MILQTEFSAKCVKKNPSTQYMKIKSKILTAIYQAPLHLSISSEPLNLTGRTSINEQRLHTRVSQTNFPKVDLWRPTHAANRAQQPAGQFSPTHTSAAAAHRWNKSQLHTISKFIYICSSKLLAAHQKRRNEQPRPQSFRAAKHKNVTLRSEGGESSSPFPCIVE